MAVFWDYNTSTKDLRRATDRSGYPGASPCPSLAGHAAALPRPCTPAPFLILTPVLQAELDDIAKGIRHSPEHYAQIGRQVLQHPTDTVIEPWDVLGCKKGWEKEFRALRAKLEGADNNHGDRVETEKDDEAQDNNRDDCAETEKDEAQAKNGARSHNNRDDPAETTTTTTTTTATSATTATTTTTTTTTTTRKPMRPSPRRTKKDRAHSRNNHDDSAETAEKDEDDDEGDKEAYAAQTKKEGACSRNNCCRRTHKKSRHPSPSQLPPISWQ